MPQHIINILDDLITNGGTPESKAQTAGIKATLEIVADTQEEVAGAMGEIRKVALLLDKHISSEKCHTPKGILVRGNVLAWFGVSAVAVFAFLYIVASALGIEELLKSLIP